MRSLETAIHVDVDPTNPGQFFACCALLELADRLWTDVEGRFSSDLRKFLVSCGDHTLAELVTAIAYCELTQIIEDDPCSSPVRLGGPFRELDIDWWVRDLTGARDLKVWAGQMKSYGIAQAMQHALRAQRFQESDLLNVGQVVMNPRETSEKTEPYYFDARRTPNSHSRDVGFAANDLGLTTTAHPAVELLCLIGLQVARPAFTSQKRIYDYTVWTTPLTANLLLAAATGALELPGSQTYRFENWFRTGQKKHKAFRSAFPISRTGDN